jgi:hypothetical protein
MIEVEVREVEGKGRGGGRIKGWIGRIIRLRGKGGVFKFGIYY